MVFYSDLSLYLTHALSVSRSLNWSHCSYCHCLVNSSCWDNISGCNNRRILFIQEQRYVVVVSCEC